MNESVLPALFFLIALLLSFEYPIIGSLFIAVPLLVAIGKGLGISRKERDSCEMCRFFDDARDRCMYNCDGARVENCNDFKPKDNGGK